MDGQTSITFAVKLAFAAANALVWTGLFLYLLRLARRVRRLEEEGSTPRSRGPRPDDPGAAGGPSARGRG